LLTETGFPGWGIVSPALFFQAGYRCGEARKGDFHNGANRS
jgi:hypothetical protein